MQEMLVFSLGWKDSPGGYGNSLQYSCLGNPMDRGAWWATVHRSQKSRQDLVTKQQQFQISLIQQMFSKCILHEKKCFAVVFTGFPGGSEGKESSCNVGDLDLISGLGRSPGERKGYPLQIFAWRIP